MTAQLRVRVTNFDIPLLSYTTPKPLELLLADLSGVARSNHPKMVLQIEDLSGNTVARIAGLNEGSERESIASILSTHHAVFVGSAVM